MNCVPQTITGLYNAIELVVCKKDVVQLDKRLRRGANPITPHAARGSTPDEIRTQVQGEVNALQALGFAGLINKMEEFSTKYLVDFCRSTMDSAPYDLLGLVHDRLVIHCLAEVPHSSQSSGLGGVRAIVEHRLHQ